MSPFRDVIRIAIFEKLFDDSLDISETIIRIKSIIEEYSKKYPEFDKKEKIDIELIVPIQIPPGGAKGDCRKVVDAVSESFNKLGGGSKIGAAVGSWLDKEDSVVSDHCLSVITSMLIKNWHESIPILETLIRDEIQAKLYQRCVFLRIDNNTYGHPINLLGDKVESFPGQGKFGEIDEECISKIEDTVPNEDISPVTIINQNTTVNQGIDPETHAQLMAENMKLKEELKKVTDEEKLSEESREDLLKREERVEEVIPTLEPWDLTKLGKVARLQGRFERAITYYRMALESFIEAENLRGISASYLNICSALTSLSRYDEAIENANLSHIFALLSKDPKGAIYAVSNIATIESNKGNFSVAEEWYKYALEMQRKISDEIGISSTLVNLAHIYSHHSKIEDAEKCIRDSLEICRKESHYEGIVTALCGLGSLLSENYQKYSEAEEHYFEAIKICKDEKLLRLKNDSKGGLANLYRSSGRLNEARELYNEILVYERKNELKRGLVESLMGLARLETEENSLDKAERLLREAHDIANAIGLNPQLAVILNNLGNILSEQSKMEKYSHLKNEKMTVGIEKCTQAYNLAKELGMERDMINPLYNLGCSQMFVFQDRLYDRSKIIPRITLDSYREVRELPWVAESYFQEGLDLSQKLDDKNRIGNFLFSLGHVAGCKAELAHFLQKHGGAIGPKEIEYNKARNFFQQALEIFQQLGNSERENEVVEIMQHLDHYK